MAAAAGRRASRLAARGGQSCDALGGGREFIEPSAALPKWIRWGGGPGDGRVAQSATLVKCSGDKGARAPACPPACLPASPSAVFARIELFGRCIAKLYAADV